MAKVVCVLYDDPVDGYPKSYPRDDLPKIDRYPDGQTLPTPKSIDFKPGTLLGSVSGELGLRKYLESHGHKLVVTSDKDGADSVLDRELPDTEIVISQPFWPAYMTSERFAKAPETEARDHRGYRLRSHRPPGGDRPQRHGRRGHLLQFDQRVRACGDDDPRPRAQLHSRRISGWCAAAGTSPIASRGPTTSKACMSAPSRPAASGSRYFAV